MKTDWVNKSWLREACDLNVKRIFHSDEKMKNSGIRKYQISVKNISQIFPSCFLHCFFFFTIWGLTGILLIKITRVLYAVVIFALSFVNRLNFSWILCTFEWKPTANFMLYKCCIKKLRKMLGMVWVTIKPFRCGLIILKSVWVMVKCLCLFNIKYSLCFQFGFKVRQQS